MRAVSAVAELVVCRHFNWDTVYICCTENNFLPLTAARHMRIALVTLSCLSYVSANEIAD